ncbi:hypothetical protein OFC63_27440, partial [Escherichia coli]|nr:hypothetical protein [Escherichia coli]
TNIMTKKLPHCCSLPKELRTGTQEGQEAGADAEAMVCSACFLIEPRTVSLRMALPTLIANYRLARSLIL